MAVLVQVPHPYSDVIDLMIMSTSHLPPSTGAAGELLGNAPVALTSLTRFTSCGLGKSDIKGIHFTTGPIGVEGAGNSLL
jgi:hypothetical protein